MSRLSGATNEEAMPKAALKIHGMDCAEEVSALRKEVEPLNGVQNLESCGGSFHALVARGG